MTRIKSQHGSLLLEMALILGILAVVVPSLLSLSRSQNAATAESLHQREKQRIEQALEGFVLSRGRLPCPAQDGETQEQFVDDRCELQSGDLPYGSLSLDSLQQQWTMTVADLAAAGVPAQHALHNTKRWQLLSLQQLSEIVLSPTTSTSGMNGSALPALSICNFNPNQALPDGTERGCGLQSLHSPTAVVVVQPKLPRTDTSTSIFESNQARSQQFFITRDYSSDNPMWMSYERLVHLWMEGGWIAQTPPS
ncbi:MAG: type II secretion system protein [Limnobacter sp.]|nr:type II secretion system protein [Limnobacter sp.]